MDAEELFIKIHLASFGVQLQGCEYNYFDVRLTKLKFTQFDGIDC